MKNRFTAVIVTTTLALSFSLLAFTTSKSAMTEKKAVNACTEKAACPKDHCPATPNCPFDNTKEDCCNDE